MGKNVAVFALISQFERAYISAIQFLTFQSDICLNWPISVVLNFEIHTLKDLTSNNLIFFNCYYIWETKCVLEI